jgi:hypothetical protein
MNIALPIQTQKISTEAAQLLAILRDCGIDILWQDPETNLLSFFLQNSEPNTNDIRFEIGHDSYAHFVKQVTYRWKYPELGAELDVLHWLLRNADGSVLRQALQVSAQENLNTKSTKLEYNEHSPGFERDHKDFRKIVTLFTIENFPTEIHFSHDFLISRLNYYEHFLHQHGNIKILKAFKKSIMRKESDNLADAERICRPCGKLLNPKTTCAAKYVNMMSYDRIRFMRYYRLAMKKYKD